ncbi:hypothetical protein ACH4U3_14655 [Streptomyces griseoruber]|uniref:hypothetical protein n=1 Tax=Streptomyces griseoruber TaxID=1943 RepID=UPI0037AC1A27
MTRLLAEVWRWSDDHADGWAKGYAEGWTAAILRVLEERDVFVPDEGHWYITTRTDLKTLAPWLDMALFVNDWRDLIRAGRAGMASSGSSAAAGNVRPVATPGTHSRRTGRKPKYVQYEDVRPARREHAPDAAP